MVAAIFRMNHPARDTYFLLAQNTVASLWESMKRIGIQAAYEESFYASVFQEVDPEVSKALEVVNQIECNIAQADYSVLKGLDAKLGHAVFSVLDITESDFEGLFQAAIKLAKGTDIIASDLLKFEDVSSITEFLATRHSVMIAIKTSSLPGHSDV